MRSLQYIQLRHTIRKSINRQIGKHKVLSDFRDQYRKDRMLRAELFLGFGKPCAPPVNSVDLARGFRYALRNSVGQPITKITLASKDITEEPKVIWERDDDDTPDEIILARAYRVKYGDPKRYVTA